MRPGSPPPVVGIVILGTAVFYAVLGAALLAAWVLP